METEVNPEYQKLIDELKDVLLNSDLKISLKNKVIEVKDAIKHLGTVPKIEDNVKNFLNVTNLLAQTYAKKNHDYGNSFDRSLDKFGLIASIVRLEDKFNRIESLINKKAEVEDEAIEDTFLDMANYCIMSYMWIKNGNKQG